MEYKLISIICKFSFWKTKNDDDISIVGYDQFCHFTFFQIFVLDLLCKVHTIVGKMEIYAGQVVMVGGVATLQILFPNQYVNFYLFSSSLFSVQCSLNEDIKVFMASEVIFGIRAHWGRPWGLPSRRRTFRLCYGLMGHYGPDQNKWPQLLLHIVVAITGRNKAATEKGLFRNNFFFKL